MSIVNTPKEHGKHVEQLRNGIEHRATWMYLLLDEARRQGLDWDDFARKAIFKCGQFHGEIKFKNIRNLKHFGSEFAYDTLRDVFDIDVVELNQEQFIMEIHYCPLVNAWIKQTSDEKDVAHLCDIAMDGDRGIISQLPDFIFNLQSTIAKGDKVCRVVISKK